MITNEGVILTRKKIRAYPVFHVEQCGHHHAAGHSATVRTLKYFETSCSQVTDSLCSGRGRGYSVMLGRIILKSDTVNRLFFESARDGVANTLAGLRVSPALSIPDRPLFSLWAALSIIFTVRAGYGLLWIAPLLLALISHLKTHAPGSRTALNRGPVSRH